MIKKIVSIKNVGRFVRYGASGDVEFKRYNLIFAENGRGKTTLCAILRSLQSGEPAHIVGRTTLGGTAVPSVIVLTDSGSAVFDSGAWSNTVPEIAIFDSMFVSENVHSGDVVDIEHKRSLYSIIVGEEGVKLAQQIDKLDEDIREKNSVIRELTAAVRAYAQGKVTAEVFIGIERDADIDQKIAEKEKELEAAKQYEQIKRRRPWPS
jgi:wobble nucleotide-excising tRNase